MKRSINSEKNPWLICNSWMRPLHFDSFVKISIRCTILSISFRKTMKFVYFHHFKTISDTTPKPFQRIDRCLSTYERAPAQTPQIHIKGSDNDSHTIDFVWTINSACLLSEPSISSHLCVDEPTRKFYNGPLFMCCVWVSERASERALDLFCYALLDFGVHTMHRRTKIQMIIIILWTETTTIFMGIVLFHYFGRACLLYIHPFIHSFIQAFTSLCIAVAVYPLISFWRDFFRWYVNLFRHYCFIYIWFGICSAW